MAIEIQYFGNMTRLYVNNEVLLLAKTKKGVARAYWVQNSTPEEITRQIDGVDSLLRLYDRPGHRFSAENLRVGSNSKESQEFAVADFLQLYDATIDEHFIDPEELFDVHDARYLTMGSDFGNFRFRQLDAPDRWGLSVRSKYDPSDIIVNMLYEIHRISHGQIGSVKENNGLTGKLAGIFDMLPKPYVPRLEED